MENSPTGSWPRASAGVAEPVAIASTPRSSQVLIPWNTRNTSVPRVSISSSSWAGLVAKATTVMFVRVNSSGDIVTEGNSAKGIPGPERRWWWRCGCICAQRPCWILLPRLQGQGFHLAGSSGSRGKCAGRCREQQQHLNTGRIRARNPSQSIGGGGGVAGVSDHRQLQVLVDAATSVRDGVFLFTGLEGGFDFAGSSGGIGSAGSVRVDQSGTITTLGHASHGIVGQSAAGEGVAGAVEVIVAADIMAHGLDSHGVLAQSAGNLGRGDISVSIGSSNVQGGSVNGSAVRLDGGAFNTVTNHGRLSALSGTAIIGSNGNDIVDNYGTVVGTVDLGTGGNAFNNYPDAIFDSGITVNLGVDQALSNAGSLSPGGLAAVLGTTLTGDFEQSASGALEIEIGGLTQESFDVLNVTGTATIDGSLEVALVDLEETGNPFVPQLGDAFTIIRAVTGLFGGFATEELPSIGPGLGWDVIYTDEEEPILQGDRSVSAERTLTATATLTARISSRGKQALASMTAVMPIWTATRTAKTSLSGKGSSAQAAVQRAWRCLSPHPSCC